MPIFEYKCKDCEHIFEVLAISKQKEANTQCEKCNSNQVEKILSVSNVRSNSGNSLSSAPPTAGCGGNSRFS